MVIKDILILGSTYLTELCVNMLKDEYNLVGYVPSYNPTMRGIINLPKVDIETKCDIKLSIQYDRIVENTDNCFNVHTGLLPDYGGTNILDYAIQNKAIEQGLTLHKMTDKIDYGPIISKITYPIIEGDTSYDLYKRLIRVGPHFVLASIKLLENMDDKNVSKCYSKKPTMYKRGEFEIGEEWKRT
tara:strand:+ start:1189 stop:1746 length:558 start_codon:yes stop_codon:yes gene_type:complete